MDEVKADNELKVLENNDFAENAQLKAIIATQKAKKVSIKVGDVEIFLRPAIPKPLRDKIVAISRQYKDADIEKADDEMYKVIAQLCLDEPYTNPAIWKYIDNETGEVPNMLTEITERLTKVEKSAQRFRRE